MVGGKGRSNRQKGEEEKNREGSKRVKMDEWKRRRPDVSKGWIVVSTQT